MNGAAEAHTKVTVNGAAPEDLALLMETVAAINEESHSLAAPTLHLYQSGTVSPGAPCLA